jgi:hypothetical protein
VVPEASGKVKTQIWAYIYTGLLICLDKLTVPFQVKKFPVFYESRSSILGDI